MMKKYFVIIVKTSTHDWEEADLVYSSYREAKRNVKELNNRFKKYYNHIQYKIIFEKY